MTALLPHPAATALAALTHHRWALPILAVVTQRGGCKLVTLSKSLHASPTSLKRALDRLAELNLVIRNPGYGHPLRPEYILGTTGALMDQQLPEALLDWSRTVDPAHQMLKKWHLPLLVALDQQPARFGDVRRRLPNATPRAVTMALKSHVAAGLLSRDVDRSYPPVPRYVLTGSALVGRDMADRVGQLLLVDEHRIPQR